MRWQGTVVGGNFDTVLDFGDAGEYNVEMSTLSFSVARTLGPRRTVRLVGGVIHDGTLKNGIRADHEISSGGLFAIGFEQRTRQGHGWTPSVDGSAYLGASWASTSSTGDEADRDYFATDLRLGAACAWNPTGNTTTYGTVRVFGGPVTWQLDGRDETGTDKYHYQIGAGASIALGDAALFAEAYVLGEQALAAGVAFTR